MKAALVKCFVFSNIFSIFVQKFRVRDSTNYHQGVCLAEMEMHLKKNGDREGLSLCGVKVSGYTMLPQALRCYAPKNPTISIVGVVSGFGVAYAMYKKNKK